MLGHGNAPNPHDPADYEAMEDMVAALVDGETDAGGFSMGARLVLAIEAQRPGTFRRIVAGGVGANLFDLERNPSAVADALEGRGEVLDPLSRAFVAVAHTPPND